MLVTMKEILDRASAENYAVAAPNVGNDLEVNAAIAAAEDLNAPLILDVKLHDTAKLPNPEEFGVWLRARCRASFVPIAINQDHGGSYESAVLNIKYGCTSVMADRSTLPYDENVREVRRVVEVARAAGCSVEAELGHVGTASQYDLDRDAGLTKPEDAVRYIKDTGIDCLAVAVGTAHGAYPKGVVPTLDFDRLAEIKAAVRKEFGDFPLVLHGSSGTPNEALYKACRMGINKVNIATDLNAAAMAACMNSDGNGSPFGTGMRAFRDKLKEMIPVYGSDGKAWTK